MTKIVHWSTYEAPVILLRI